ncbi:MAG TPA: hypothetical protein VNT51_01455, partial [Miltoncostaeaceae bacterium]|nr:hypothetical protein [Miltoncostaeaceae bacterium]
MARRSSKSDGALDAGAMAAPASGSDEPYDETCWFRSSDDVRHGFVRGIDTFDLKHVTYSQIGDMAIFEGDIALGTDEEMRELADAVAAEPTDAVRALAATASPGEVLHGVGLPGLRFRWPNGLVPY